MIWLIFRFGYVLLADIIFSSIENIVNYSMENRKIYHLGQKFFFTWKFM